MPGAAYAEGVSTAPTASPAPADPTGRRFRLRRESGDTVATAEIASVGAALRAYSSDGVDLVPRYPDTSATPAASGVVLVPWPNRVAGATWTQRGETHRLAISEPATGAASHGLLRFASYKAVSEDGESVTLEADVVPQTGYPFHLRTEVRYALTDDGLEVTHTVENVGAAAAPVALGTHPYLCIDGVDTADLTLQLDAPLRSTLDADLIPIEDVPVDAATDLRTPRRIGELDLNYAYAGMPRDAADRITATLTAPDGRAVTLWAGTGFTHLQVFTTDRYPGSELAVAIEPMTAPANAFNTGENLRWLEPGERWTLRWGVAPKL